MSSVVSSNRSSRAFTLIELLTVIAIIGILAAILIPTVGKVRATARNAQCVSRLRDWGTAIHLYANDNKGKYRISNWLSAASNPYQSYFPGSSQQMATIRSFAGCPLLNQTLAEGTMCYSMVWPSINGSINTLLADEVVAGSAQMNVSLNRCAAPAKFLMMCDSMIGSSPRVRGSDSGSSADFPQMIDPLFGAAPVNPGTRGDETVARRHGGTKANGVFGDGSVKSFNGVPAPTGDTNSIYAMRTVWFQLY